MLKRLLCLLAIALAAAAAPARAVAAPQPVQSVEGITEYRLANGLQILLAPDESKPTTTVNVTYHVGSRHENYGETGMAHLLEHLLFKGSPATPDPKAEFARRGLNFNGTTSFDRTNYFASFAADAQNLKWYLDWQADAMVHSFIARKDLDSEMTVVRNEMESGENNPQTVLWQRGLASLFDWHNYGKPTIGARADVENVDIARLQAFYRRYYQPDNATLIVSGRFDPAQVLGWAEAAFGKLEKPARTLPALYTLDPAQDGERAYTVRRAGGVPLLLASYHAPAAASPDYAAVEAIAQILLDEPSGRLHKRLVQRGLAAGVWGWAWDLADPGAMMFGVQLAPGQDVEAARAGLLAAVESIAAEPITAEELARAKANWLNDWNRRFTNADAVGVALSDAVGQGDWRLFFLLRDRVRDLKLADVQRVATQYLLPSNRALGVYLPTEQPLRAPAPQRVVVAAMVRGYKGDPAAAQAEAFDASPANIDARTQRFDLASGMQVALLPKGSRGQAVQARLVLRYGDEKSLYGSGEAPEFSAELLDRGTPTLTREQIQDRFAALRAQVRFGAAAGATTVAITTVRDTLPEVIALVGRLLRESSYPESEVEEIKRQTLAELEVQRKEPHALVANALARHGNPYPRGDVRYARTFDEIAADVQAVRAGQLREFHRRFYGASHAQFGASGDMDAAAVKQALEAAFGDWRSPVPYTRVPTPLVQVAPGRFVIRTPDKQNATFAAVLALPISDNDRDYAAFMLANRILGQDTSSRLWTRVREKEGLSYDVRSGVAWSSREPNSPWQASAIFAPQNQPKVEAAVKEELARALKEGFTAQELDQAKGGLLALRRLSRSQDANLATALAVNLDLGRTFAVAQRIDEAIRAATLDEVNAALRKYLDPAKLVYAFGGDFKP
jgi:zinc protease